MSLNHLIPATLACALILGACAQEEAPESEVTETEEEEVVAVPVEVGLPIRGDVFAVYSGTAPIEAFAEADVIAKVAGEVREILVEEGDRVTRGQVLARLDGDRLRLELNQSEANLRKLQRDYERNVDLKDKGLISSGAVISTRFATSWRRSKLPTTSPNWNSTTRKSGPRSMGWFQPAMFVSVTPWRSMILSSR